MLLMLEQTGLCLLISNHRSGLSSSPNQGSLGNLVCWGVGFTPHPSKEVVLGPHSAPLDELFQVVYFWSLCSWAEYDRGQSAQLSSFHPALHNLSALWALQVLCVCFLAEESHWETSLAQAHGVSHSPGTEQKFNCVSFLLPRK